MRKPWPARRLAKWTAAGLCVLIVVLFFVSLPWTFAYRGTGCTIGLERGRVWWFGLGSRGPDVSPVTTGVQRNQTGTRPQWSWTFERWDPHLPDRSGLKSVAVPLWAPWLIAAAGTLGLWWRGRHGAPRGESEPARRACMTLGVDAVIHGLIASVVAAVVLYGVYKFVRVEDASWAVLTSAVLLLWGVPLGLGIAVGWRRYQTSRDDFRQGGTSGDVGR